MEPLIVENFRLQVAAELAAMGWQVIPLHQPRNGGSQCSCGDAACKSPAKHPRTANGLKDATADGSALAKWWGSWPGANVGIVTGADSGLVVLDVDPRHGGDESLVKLEGEFGELPVTVRAVTGGGGIHVYLAHPGRPIRNSTNRVGPGLDVRGDGGYVVAPPSLHTSGNRYGWESGFGPDDVPLAPIPGWLLSRMTEPAQTPAPFPPKTRPARDDDTAGHWLGRALMKADCGTRNDTGLWLATQMRDSGVGRSEAEATMREYARRAPRGETAYSETEAMKTVASAYSRPPREPARGMTYAGKVIRQARESAGTPQKPTGAAAELGAHMEDVFARKFYNVPWPWPQTTRLTQALLPGSITVVCGDPGVGKTFFCLDCMRDWLANGHEPAAFFIEKDRKFHTRRLLAQLEADGRFVDMDWVRDNPDPVRAALARHGGIIDQLGRVIYSSPAERVTLDLLLGWVRQQASAGRRILLVDPITAAFAGVDRWTRDDDFVLAAQAVLNAHGASLVLVTHPVKFSGKNGGTSGHQVGGGAAYFRFCDTLIWLHRPKQPRRVRYRTAVGTAEDRFGLFFQLHKTRDGRGGGLDVAFRFGEDLRFSEQGVVVADVADSDDHMAEAI